MTWYEDLSGGGSLLHVGWLGDGKPFTHGEVEEQVVSRLAELRETGVVPFVTFGVHPCELCEGQEKAVDTGEVFVPGQDALFMAPSMILHYINDHRYLPPPVFCRAVLACPRPGTLSYFHAFTKHAPEWSSPELWSRDLFDPSSFQASTDDLAELEKLWERGFDVAPVVAAAHAAHGDVDAALAWIHRAQREGAIDVEDVTSDARFELLRTDARFETLVQEMTLVVPCIYDIGTLGLPSPTDGELDLSGADAITFRFGPGGGESGTVVIPHSSIFKIEVPRDGRLLMIRYKEPPARYRNAGFVVRSRPRGRPWRQQSLLALQARSGRRIEIVLP